MVESVHPTISVKVHENGEVATDAHTVHLLYGVANGFQSRVLCEGMGLSGGHGKYAYVSNPKIRAVMGYL